MAFELRGGCRLPTGPGDTPTVTAGSLSIGESWGPVCELVTENCGRDWECSARKRDRGQSSRGVFEGGRKVRSPSLVGYLMWMPEMARLITNLWISLVPSKMV